MTHLTPEKHEIFLKQHSGIFNITFSDLCLLSGGQFKDKLDRRDTGRYPSGPRLVAK